MRQFYNVMSACFMVLGCLSMPVLVSSAQAQCNVSAAGDHVCGKAGSGPQKAAPPTPGGQSIKSAQAAPPIATGDVVDYSRTSANTRRDVASNLTQESTRLASGTCARRTLAPGTTTSIPFVYDGTNSSLNVPQVDGQGSTRTFVSTMPGYDPQTRLAPGAENDYYSPCHAHANLYYSCGEDGSYRCLSPYSENRINVKNADTVVGDPKGNATQCPLVPGDRYFINIQNTGSTTQCVAIGNGTSCPPC